MTHELIHYRTDEGSVSAIIGTKGRIYTPLVYIDSPIRKFMVPNGDIEKFRRDVPESSKPTVRKAARIMLKAGKKLGIRKGAKMFLRSCL